MRVLLKNIWFRHLFSVKGCSNKRWRRDKTGKLVGVQVVLLDWEFSGAFYSQFLVFHSRQKIKYTRRRNHSTVPAEEQISHNGGLRLNWMNKKKEPQRVCVWRSLAALFVVCFSAHETNRATPLSSRHQTLLGFKTFCVSSSCAVPTTR